MLQIPIKALLSIQCKSNLVFWSKHTFFSNIFSIIFIFYSIQATVLRLFYLKKYMCTIYICLNIILKFDTDISFTFGDIWTFQSGERNGLTKDKTPKPRNFWCCTTQREYISKVIYLCGYNINLQVLLCSKMVQFVNIETFIFKLQMCEQNWCINLLKITVFFTEKVFT